MDVFRSWIIFNMLRFFVTNLYWVEKTSLGIYRQILYLFYFHRLIYSLKLASSSPCGEIIRFLVYFKIRLLSSYSGWSCVPRWKWLWLRSFKHILQIWIDILRPIKGYYPIVPRVHVAILRDLLNQIKALLFNTLLWILLTVFVFMNINDIKLVYLIIYRASRWVL